MNAIRIIPRSRVARDDRFGVLPSTDMHSGFSVTPLHMELDRLFDSIFKSVLPHTAVNDKDNPVELRPELDISGNEKQYTITVDVPGVDPADLHVELDQGSLRIHGEKRRDSEESDEKNGNRHFRVERSFGSFQRVLALPEDVDADNISASHKDGVLSIILPRLEVVKPEARQIAIATAGHSITEGNKE